MSRSQVEAKYVHFQRGTWQNWLCRGSLPRATNPCSCLPHPSFVVLWLVSTLREEQDVGSGNMSLLTGNVWVKSDSIPTSNSTQGFRLKLVPQLANSENVRNQWEEFACGWDQNISLRENILACWCQEKPSAHQPPFSLDSFLCSLAISFIRKDLK